MTATYEWFCTTCGVVTYVDENGGPTGCLCKWDPPLEKWEDSERTRRHAEQQMIFKIDSGRREYMGTATDLVNAA